VVTRRGENIRADVTGATPALSTIVQKWPNAGITDYKKCIRKVFRLQDHLMGGFPIPICG
jgi:hypothetical protein